MVFYDLLISLSRGRSKSGSAMIVIMTLASILLLAAAVTSMASVSDINVTSEEKIKTELEFACESGLNRAKAKVEESYNNSGLSALEPAISFQGTEVDDTDNTPEDKAYPDETFMLSSDQYVPDYYTYVVQPEDGGREIIVKYAITEDADWEKHQTYTNYSMNIEAAAYSPGYGWIGMTEKASARRSTLFMYNIFFNDELEILPGPNFNLQGLIHTNKGLYLSTNATLTIKTNSMTAAGEIFRRRYNTTESLGTVKISTGDEDGVLTIMNNSPREDATNTDWVNLATGKWEGTVRDKHLGATKLEAPKLASFQPGGFYDQEAGLRIKVIAKDQPSPLYEITYDNSTTLTNASLGDALSEVQFYDRRESTTKQVKATQLDLQKLKATPYWPPNGLIYITRDDAVPDQDGNPYSPDPNRVVSGIKLVNGSVLGDATTFVTDLPMYVKGDFNKHTSADPLVDTWKPAAVVADAINVLSNAWVDSQSSAKRAATTTTFNLVFITGNVPSNTTNGQYSGGLENFPRMLENWSGQSLNINGGFMQLFRSQYATANWVYGGYYDAPTRNWAAEQRFNNINDFPPMFTDLFPSTNFGIAFSNWAQIAKDESSLVE